MKRPSYLRVIRQLVNSHQRNSSDAELLMISKFTQELDRHLESLSEDTFEAELAELLKTAAAAREAPAKLKLLLNFVTTLLAQPAAPGSSRVIRLASEILPVLFPRASSNPALQAAGKKLFGMVCGGLVAELESLPDISGDVGSAKLTRTLFEFPDPSKDSRLFGSANSGTINVKNTVLPKLDIGFATSSFHFGFASRSSRRQNLSSFSVRNDTLTQRLASKRLLTFAEDLGENCLTAQLEYLLFKRREDQLLGEIRNNGPQPDARVEEGLQGSLRTPSLTKERPSNFRRVTKISPLPFDDFKSPYFENSQPVLPNESAPQSRPNELAAVRSKQSLLESSQRGPESEKREGGRRVRGEWTDFGKKSLAGSRTHASAGKHPKFSFESHTKLKRSLVASGETALGPRSRKSTILAGSVYQPRRTEESQPKVGRSPKGRRAGFRSPQLLAGPKTPQKSAAGAKILWKSPISGKTPFFNNSIRDLTKVGGWPEAAPPNYREQTTDTQRGETLTDDPKHAPEKNPGSLSRLEGLSTLLLVVDPLFDGPKESFERTVAALLSQKNVPASILNRLVAILRARVAFAETVGECCREAPRGWREAEALLNLVAGCLLGVDSDALMGWAEALIHLKDRIVVQEENGRLLEKWLATLTQVLAENRTHSLFLVKCFWIDSNLVATLGLSLARPGLCPSPQFILAATRFLHQGLRATPREYREAIWREWSKFLDQKEASRPDRLLLEGLLETLCSDRTSPSASEDLKIVACVLRGGLPYLSNAPAKLALLRRVFLLFLEQYCQPDWREERREVLCGLAKLLRKLAELKWDEELRAAFGQLRVLRFFCKELDLEHELPFFGQKLAGQVREAGRPDTLPPTRLLQLSRKDSSPQRDSSQRYWGANIASKMVNSLLLSTCTPALKGHGSRETFPESPPFAYSKSGDLRPDLLRMRSLDALPLPTWSATQSETEVPKGHPRHLLKLNLMSLKPEQFSPEKSEEVVSPPGPANIRGFCLNFDLVGKSQSLEAINLPTLPLLKHESQRSGQSKNLLLSLPIASEGAPLPDPLTLESKGTTLHIPQRLMESRRIYSDGQLHSEILRLVCALLLNPSLTSLDETLCGQYPAQNGKRHYLFILQRHLSGTQGVQRSQAVFLQLKSEIARRSRQLKSLRRENRPIFGETVARTLGLKSESTGQPLFGDSTVQHRPGDHDRDFEESSFRSQFVEERYFNLREAIICLLKCLTPTGDGGVEPLEKLGSGAYSVVKKAALLGDPSFAVKCVAADKSVFDRSSLFYLFSEVCVLNGLRRDTFLVHRPPETCQVAELVDFRLASEHQFLLLFPCYAPRVPTVGHLQNTVRVFLEVALNLKFLHDRGVVHYDVKADNIVRGPKGHVLVDFGECLRYEQSLRLRGTELVRSPEMVQSRLEDFDVEANDNESRFRDLVSLYNRQSKFHSGMACDVWAFGCLLYELFTGEMLFYEKDWTGFYRRIRDESTPLLTPDNLRKIGNDFVLQTLLNFILVRNPQQRPAIDSVLTKVEGAARLLGIDLDEPWNPEMVGPAPQPLAAPFFPTSPSQEFFGSWPSALSFWVNAELHVQAPLSRAPISGTEVVDLKDFEEQITEGLSSSEPLAKLKMICAQKLPAIFQSLRRASLEGRASSVQGATGFGPLLLVPLVLAAESGGMGARVFAQIHRESFSQVRYSREGVQILHWLWDQLRAALQAAPATFVVCGCQRVRAVVTKTPKDQRGGPHSGAAPNNLFPSSGSLRKLIGRNFGTAPSKEWLTFRQSQIVFSPPDSAAPPWAEVVQGPHRSVVVCRGCGQLVAALEQPLGLAHIMACMALS